MSFQLRTWPRQFFEEGGGQPFLVYYVYGTFPNLPTMKGEVYQSAGVPKGLALELYNRRQHRDVLDSFLGGHFGNFLDQKPELAEAVRASDQCIVLKGFPADSGTLNYLRDCVGVLTYLLDHGGVGILDPQTLAWWRPSEWKEQIFKADAIHPLKHITLLGSPEASDQSRLWLHTRGLRKFGRPDLSIHNVDQERQPAFLDVIERYVTFQAFGGIITEGEEFLPEGFSEPLHCHHRGDDDDPEFNNRHVVIE